MPLGGIWSPATLDPGGNGFDKALSTSTSIANARSAAIAVRNPPRLFRISVRRFFESPTGGVAGAKSSTDLFRSLSPLGFPKGKASGFRGIGQSDQVRSSPSAQFGGILDNETKTQ